MKSASACSRWKITRVKMRERSSSVGSNQTEKHPRDIFCAPYVRKCHVNLSRHVLWEFYPPPLSICTRSLCNFGDFMSVVRNSSRRDFRACWNKIVFTKEKQCYDCENSRFHRNRYIRPSDCELAILFSLVLIQHEIGDCDIS